MNTHLIIDNAFDETQLQWPESSILGVMLLMAFARRNCPEYVVWAGVDAYNEYEITYRVGKAHGTLIDFLVENWEDNVDHCCCLTILSEVMRCSQNVFKLAYGINHKWVPKLRPHLGHKLQGFQITISKDFKNIHEARAYLIYGIEDEVQNISKLDIDLSSFAIITGGYGSKDARILRDYLREQLHSSYFRSIRVKEDNSKEMSAKTRLSTKRNDITIMCWDEVSSLEWPSVVFVSCLPKEIKESYELRQLAYQQYRAASRATTGISCTVCYYSDDDDIKPLVPTSNRSVLSLYLKEEYSNDCLYDSVRGQDTGLLRIIGHLGFSNFT